jgi:hypothetical protein
MFFTAYHTFMRRVLQFLQPARDLRCERRVIFLSWRPSCRSLADGDSVLDAARDKGESCCMLEVWV